MGVWIGGRNTTKFQKMFFPFFINYSLSPLFFFSAFSFFSSFFFSDRISASHVHIFTFIFTVVIWNILQSLPYIKNLWLYGYEYWIENAIHNLFFVIQYEISWAVLNSYLSESYSNAIIFCKHGKDTTFSFEVVCICFHHHRWMDRWVGGWTDGLTDRYIRICGKLQNPH